MAFEASFLKIENNWYLVINPTWSYTNPGGYKVSRFEPEYMSGIKRLENNNSVYTNFRFFVYYLAKQDLFSKKYPYMEISQIAPFSLAPSLDEQKWKPVKNADEDSDAIITELTTKAKHKKPTLFD